MAERSKALRSGRSPLLWAWVRIPLLTNQYFFILDSVVPLAQRSWVRSLDGMLLFPNTLINVRMAEWSKAPDSRHSLALLIGSAIENSGPRMRAWVQIPLLTKLFSTIPLLTNCFPPTWLKCFVQSDASVAQ